MAVGHWRTPLLRKPPDRRHLSTLANDNNTEGREIYSSTGRAIEAWERHSADLMAQFGQLHALQESCQKAGPEFAAQQWRICDAPRRPWFEMNVRNIRVAETFS